MDFDGDGRKDLLSGSWPGDLYLFRQKADGTWAEGEILKGKDGKPLRAAPANKKSNGSASVAFAFDWDADGDLDLLGGNIGGEIYLFNNEGSAKEPAYAAPVAVEAGGKPVKVAGDAGPVVADWDADGKPDLLSGAGDGSVQWFRNTGADKTPKLAEAVELLPASAERKRGLLGVLEKKKTGDQPGTRSKVCVADYNGDGKADLLVGDFASRPPEPKKLTAEQEAERDKGREEMQKLFREYATLSPSVEVDEDDEPKPKQPAKDDPAAAEAAEKLKKVQERLMALQARMGELEERSTYHGWVWVYLRQDDPGKSPKDTAARAEGQ